MIRGYRGSQKMKWPIEGSKGDDEETNLEEEKGGGGEGS